MIQSAELEFSSEGIPFSPAFDDVYHTADGGEGQARHVFMAGNDLPTRWSGCDVFVILETGFGLGLNFLVTWQAWRADSWRCRQLHFVSVEKFPFRGEDLRRLHAAWPRYAALSDELIRHWPGLTAGRHDLLLDEGRVCLTLLFGDALETLPQLRLEVDAIYLDGFAPAKNPEMWSGPLFGQLNRLAAPGCSLATWSVAGQVRRGLAEAGFKVSKAAGFGGKRQMLTGRRSEG